MQLDKVVPWGRSLNEYIKMFSLAEGDLNKSILGCGDGPASFNAELTETGGSIVSADPVYQFNAEQIRSRIDAVYPHILSQLAKESDKYVWETIADVEELGHLRMKAMEIFLSDYNDGKKSGRYIQAALPELPFEEKVFDLALCSHYLFLYSEQVDQVQHMLSVKELCRVAKEVRVYPLLSLDGVQSKHLDPVISSLKGSGFEASLQPVEYQFQRGATEMLVVQEGHAP